MKRFPSLRTIALLLTAASPAPALAQGTMIAPISTPNADRLSAQMRILGSNPNDLSALIEAGRLSGKLGDTDAAMQFLARAERVSASDPRIKAARAATLVTMERPGEALALFAAAEQAGLSMAPYYPDRGLAFDLMGAGGHAQRDYRLALAQGADDEVVRRLALSLGIGGDVAGSTALLNPLLQQNDRAAWRVRACVLAMSGDAAGADRIAASMLPGFGPSLAPFFRRLPTLSAPDRAFAVHFGRLAPTPERIADARLAPSIAPLPARAAGVAVAANDRVPLMVGSTTRSTTRTPSRREQRLARQREVADARARELAATQAAAKAARDAQLASARAAENARLAALQRAETERLAVAQRERDAQQLAAQQAEAARLAEATRQEAVRVAARQAEERRVAAEALAERDRQALAARAAAAPATPVAPAVAPRVSEPAPAPVVAPATIAPITLAGAETPVVAPAAPSAVAAVAPRPSTNDDVLARIIRNLDIPAEELGVAPMPGAEPAVGTMEAANVETAAAQAAQARELAAAREAADARKVADARKLADAKKAADAKKLADAKKAADAKKLADAKKAEDAEKAAAAKLKKADPRRFWVQVATGANEGDLPKAWKGLSAKASALKTRQAWTTPLRYTNRLLTGPFKSADEAQSFVNTLAKSGVSASAFTSEAGQKVARVPVS